MEKIDIKELHKGFSSYELRDDLIEKVSKDDFILNVAYTDYGGDFFDKVAIAYFKKHYPENILVENTCYSGENAFIFGNIAKEFFENTQDYLLAFEDIEDLFYQMENDLYYEDFKYFLNDIKSDYIFDHDIVFDYLLEEKQGQYSVHANMIDFGYNDLINELLQNNLIFEENQGLLSLFIKNGYTPKSAQYYVDQYENNTIKDLYLNEKTISIIKEYENSLN